MRETLAQAIHELEQAGADAARVAKLRDSADAGQRKILLKAMPESQAKVARIHMKAFNALMTLQGTALEVG